MIIDTNRPIESYMRDFGLLSGREEVARHESACRRRLREARAAISPEGLSAVMVRYRGEDHLELFTPAHPANLTTRILGLLGVESRTYLGKPADKGEFFYNLGFEQAASRVRTDVVFWQAEPGALDPARIRTWRNARPARAGQVHGAPASLRITPAYDGYLEAIDDLQPILAGARGDVATGRD